MIFRVFLVIALLITATWAVADEHETVTVEVFSYVIDVQAISSSDQNFVANVFYRFLWNDPELAHDSDENIVRDLEDIWHPRIQIVNQQKLWETLPEQVDISPEGDVMYRQRVWGTFSEPLDLKEFPFDHQEFAVQFVVLAEHERTVQLVSDTQVPSGIADRLTLADWKITGLRVNNEPFSAIPGQPPLSGFAVVLTGQRHVGYYLFKIILPLMLITVMSWLVFWIHPGQAGTKISVSVTSMLTLIAYRFMISGFLPSISYLTRLDILVLGSTLLVFATLLSAVATGSMAQREREAQAYQVDRGCRVVFPSLYGVLVVLTMVV